MKIMEWLVVAVSRREFDLWGCPYCSCSHGDISISLNSSSVWRCKGCGKKCCVLDGVSASPFGFFKGDSNKLYYPEVRQHPRCGNPKWISPEIIPGCLVCGGSEGLQSPGGVCRTCACSGSVASANRRSMSLPE